MTFDEDVEMKGKTWKKVVTEKYLKRGQSHEERKERRKKRFVKKERKKTFVITESKKHY